MAKESVLTEKEKKSIEIQKFIFHVIVEKQQLPVYLDEVVLDKDQVEFFRKRFIDASEGTQFMFTDPGGLVATKCSDLVGNPTKNFHDRSKDLAAAFRAVHTKATNDGVFITALVRVLKKVDLVFLVKLDHKKVYEYKLKDKKAIMEEIKNSFVEDRKAIQKIAIVNPGNHYKWDVLAYDRTPGHGKAISDFFRNFLLVAERETATSLTEKTISAIRKWASENMNDLDPDEEVAAYKQRCLEYLRNAQLVDTGALIRAVTRDRDPQRRKKLQGSLKDYLAEQGLSGQAYQPSQSIVKKHAAKNIAKTAEGIKIEWEGEQKDVNIHIPTTADNEGMYNITIRTSGIEFVR